ncbi:MAG TPA: protein kinase [Gemmata sp.]
MTADEPDKTVERDPDATLVRAPEQQPNPAGAVGVPGYELGRELGRGGMGVVYEAKQTGLNRPVALKMLLAGPYADPSLRARFLLEAESVAALEHPHIVRVFAFGEHDGHPFLAMEFVPGGTLAKRVKERGPLPAAEASELLVKLAHAVAHAHSRGVVHRDIKPLNVLLTSDGEPRLTDFGLAKVGRADQHLSMTGQVLGTPAYMAPEQAAGKVREVGTAADVYALGAVLYDLLTGRPPFGGDSVAVTLQKVISEEPARPRKWNAAIPRDLETICLKCLEKDPAKRYPTAQALADDLLRYLRNEPLTVRPSGALERGYKWVKRNKVVAGAITAVSLALVVGAGVSLGFGLYANDQAEEAKRQKKDAEDAAEREKREASRADRERDNAIRAGNDLRQKNAELTDAQQRTNRALAKALLGPLRPDTHALTPHEQESLWHIAESRRKELSWLFIEEATQTALTGQQLQNRAEYMLHATTGLDSGRRDAVDRLLRSRIQQSADITMALRLSCATALWGGSSPALASKSTHVLLAALREPQTPRDRRALVEMLAALAARMERGEATKMCTEAMTILTGAMDMNDRHPLEKRSFGLSELSHFVAPADAAEVLLNAMKKEPNGGGREDLARGLSTATARMSRPTDAAKVLLRAMEKETESSVQRILVARLSELTSRMEPVASAKVATEAAEKLLALMRERSGVLGHRPWLGSCVAIVTDRVEPMTAQRMCAEAAEIQLDILREWKGSGRTQVIAEGLVALAARLEPTKARNDVCLPAVDILLLALKDTRDIRDCEGRAETLSTVAAQLGPARATEILLAAMRDEKRASVRADLAAGLSAAVGGMEAAQGARVCAEAVDLLLDAMRTDTFVNTRQKLARSVSRLANRLDQTLATNKCEEVILVLLRSMEEQGDLDWALIPGLTAVIPRIEERRAADLLLTLIKKQSRPTIVLDLAECLSAVTARMDPTQGAQKCAEAIDVLLALMRSVRAVFRATLAEGIVSLAARVEPHRSIQIRTLLAESLLADTGGVSDPNFPDYPLYLAESLKSNATGVTENGWRQNRNALLLATGCFSSRHSVAPALSLLHTNMQPQPRLLPPQTLVELLKHPFCVGEARRAVLDALAFTYNRPFKDQWEFVEYAQKHQPQLDLLTPPRRPEPRP